MNNAQFRNLVQNDKPTQAPSNASTSSGAFKTPMLGSRARSSVPMTPRSVAGYNASKEFTRQLAEHKQSLDGEPPMKKFKSKAAPRGTKLAQGYNDRTQLRQDESDDDKAKRLKALEEMLKLQQIDQATFEKLRESIGVGGDLNSTHLVKGLDWKLLEKVRRGDNVEKSNEEEEPTDEDKVDVDEELDQALDKEVIAFKKEISIERQEAKTKPGEVQAMTRDEIIRRLKESRNGNNAAARIPEPVLGDKFKKVVDSNKSMKKKFVETVDGRRREVLVITDKDGKIKRKTRWLEPETASIISKPVQQPLGMEVPAEFAAKQKALLEQQAAEDEDDDIFQGVGTEYDPLKDLGSDSEESHGEEQKPNGATDASNTMSKSRNYFSTTAEDEEMKSARPIAQDPTILAALKRAAALRQSEEQAGGNSLDDTIERDPERELKQRQFLEKQKQRDREDDRDMDLGFGESRFGDDEDEDGPIWDGDEGEEEGKSGGRKRRPKKRKGDKDNVGDVMRVLEGRKKA